MRLLYLDCFSGISGDMTLGALADAGADRDYIEDELKKLRSEPFKLEWKRVVKRGISALKLNVIVDPTTQPQYHRHYSDIVKMIVEAGFSNRVQKLSLAIFEKIAAAEAKIHGIPVEKVHFHEVGAIDSIVDAVGVALALDSLHIDKIAASPVPLGSGTVHCDHGIYPVPAPATLEMMRGLPIAPAAYTMEMTTPTGAGIIAGLAEDFYRGLPPMIVESIGYGAGTRDLPNQPNVLRAVIGHLDPSMNKWQESFYTLDAPLQHGHSHEEHHRHHHGHDHAHSHEHSHSHGHHHEHEHGHSHDHHHEHEHGHSHDHHHEHEHKHNHSHHDQHEHKHSHSHDHHHEHEHDHSHDHEHEHSHSHDQLGRH